MIKSVVTFKWKRENTGAIVKMCGASPVCVDGVTWLEGSIEELVTLNEKDGNVYVKIENGPRAGKVYTLPKRVKAAVLTLGENGPAVVYELNGRRGEIILA